MQIYQALYGVVVTPQRALIHRAAPRKGHIDGHYVSGDIRYSDICT